PSPHTRGKPRLLDVGRRIPARDRFARDSPLEGDGFEPSVPRHGELMKFALTPSWREDGLHDSPLEGDGFEISVPRCLATANSVGAFISAGEWPLLEPPKLLYRFAEADDRFGDSAAPTVGRPQHDRSLDTAAYLARNNFESIPL